MNQENKENNNLSYQLKEMPLTFNDILIPTSLYNQNHHSRKKIEQQETKIDPTIKINSPPRYFKLDKPDGNSCPKLYKKCHGKDVTCLSDLKKYEGCEMYQKYKAKHPKKNNNHLNPKNNNSGLENKTVQ
ncbi:MAG: hypothetical protein AABW67_00515 [Nanoarchaeota archaeon]